MKRRSGDPNSDGCVSRDASTGRRLWAVSHDAQKHSAQSVMSRLYLLDHLQAGQRYLGGGPAPAAIQAYALPTPYLATVPPAAVDNFRLGGAQGAVTAICVNHVILR